MIFLGFQFGFIWQFFLLVVQYLFIDIDLKKGLIRVYIFSDAWLWSALITNDKFYFYAYYIISTICLFYLLYKWENMSTVKETPLSNTQVLVLFILRGLPPSPLFFTKVGIIINLINHGMLGVAFWLIICQIGVILLIWYWVKKLMIVIEVKFFNRFKKTIEKYKGNKFLKVFLWVWVVLKISIVYYFYIYF